MPGWRPPSSSTRTPLPRCRDRPAKPAGVYPRRVSGRFRNIKWAALVLLLGLYYLLPWIRWDRGPAAPDQAILVDMAGRRLYFFWIEIWPQEIYFLTGVLVLAAFGLFLATALFGRVWCGFACPQTVWTDLFLWVERLIEGDRLARMRLDRQPLTVGKAIRKTIKHAAWLLIALATGGAWVMYFNDAPTVVRGFFTGAAGAVVYVFVGLFTATTYLLAGWAREQVCTTMCPWPRIQGGLLDQDSLAVTYRDWRGEPRGPHKKGASWAGRGDCIDCEQCVVVCPTGVDIRDGLQLGCIGCGLCIDACNDVMAKVDRPPFLIAWDSARNQELLAAGQPANYRLLRPRTLIYAVLVAARGPRDAGRAGPALQHRHQRPPRPQPAVRDALRRQHPQRLHDQDPEPAARGAALSAVACRRSARHLSGRRGRAGDIGPGRAAGDAGRRVDLPGLRHAAALGRRSGRAGRSTSRPPTP